MSGGGKGARAFALDFPLSDPASALFFYQKKYWILLICSTHSAKSAGATYIRHKLTDFERFLIRNGSFFGDAEALRDTRNGILREHQHMFSRPFILSRSLIARHADDNIRMPAPESTSRPAQVKREVWDKLGGIISTYLLDQDSHRLCCVSRSLVNTCAQWAKFAFRVRYHLTDASFDFLDQTLPDLSTEISQSVIHRSGVFSRATIETAASLPSIVGE
jgi:hypothetical protein